MSTLDGLQKLSPTQACQALAQAGSDLPPSLARAAATDPEFLQFLVDPVPFTAVELPDAEPRHVLFSAGGSHVTVVAEDGQVWLGDRSGRGQFLEGRVAVEPQEWSHVRWIDRPVLRRRPMLTRVWPVAFSPDGQRLVVGDTAGTLRIWQVEPLHLLATRPPASWVSALPPGGTGLGPAPGGVTEVAVGTRWVGRVVRAPAALRRLQLWGTDPAVPTLDLEGRYWNLQGLSDEQVTVTETFQRRAWWHPWGERETAWRVLVLDPMQGRRWAQLDGIGVLHSNPQDGMWSGLILDAQDHQMDSAMGGHSTTLHYLGLGQWDPQVSARSSRPVELRLDARRIRTFRRNLELVDGRAEFAPDGRTAAVWHYRGVQWWRVADGVQISVVDVEPGLDDQLVFATDSSWAAYLSASRYPPSQASHVFLVRVGGRRTTPVALRSEKPLTVGLSPAGETLAVGYAGRLEFYRIAGNAPLEALSSEAIRAWRQQGFCSEPIWDVVLALLER